MHLKAGQTVPLDADHEERAIYVLDGEIDIAGDRFGGDRLLVFKPGDGIYLLRRVLDFGGRPVVLDEISLPAALFGGLTRARFAGYPGSMYGFFETEFGVRMVRAEERLHAVAAERAAAELLDVPSGSPLLAVDRVSFTYGDRPVEVRRGLCSTRHAHYWNALT